MSGKNFEFDLTESFLWYTSFFILIENDINLIQKSFSEQGGIILEKTKKFKGSTFVIALLGAVTFFCILGTVYCQDRRINRAENLNYRTMERACERELRELLEEKGYRNSAVTMNSITQADGARSYIVTIHHRKIESLNAIQKNALAAECRRMEGCVENCDFHFN